MWPAASAALRRSIVRYCLGAPKRALCAQLAAKEAEKVSAFFNAYKDPDEDHIGPDGARALAPCATAGLGPAPRRRALTPLGRPQASRGYAAT